AGSLLAAGLAAPVAAQTEEERLARLTPEHRAWVEEEVAYIVTDAEREFFLALPTFEERQRFIEAFWRKRDPDPASPVNEAEEEHYRRLAFANLSLADDTTRPGWMTDRGRMFILLGEPRERQRFDGLNEIVSTELWFYQSEPGVGLPSFFYLASANTGSTTRRSMDREACCAAVTPRWTRRTRHGSSSRWATSLRNSAGRRSPWTRAIPAISSPAGRRSGPTSCWTGSWKRRGAASAPTISTPPAGMAIASAPTIRSTSFRTGASFGRCSRPTPARSSTTRSSWILRTWRSRAMKRSPASTRSWTSALRSATRRAASCIPKTGN
ncbi:MAG: GWxTD domain-containing protein, partial [Gemmatimonadetes bacterium]|nr:GWxTD domain-containing protein [Gemmatimonadota bacterium]